MLSATPNARAASAPLVRAGGEDDPAGGVLVYCCGPEGLLAAAEQRCAAWPADALHLERFSAKPQPEPAVGEEAPFERM